MTRRENLLEKYEEMALAEPQFPFKPEISKETRMIARRLRRGSVESYESIEGFFNSKSLLTHQRGSVERISRKSFEEVLGDHRHRQNSQRTIYPVDTSSYYQSKTSRRSIASIPINDITMASFERELRREKSPYRDIDNQRLIMSRRDIKKDLELTQKILRSRSRKRTQTKSIKRQSSALVTRTKTPKRLVKKIYIPNPLKISQNLQNQNSQISLKSIKKRSKSQLSKKRSKRKPFDPIKSGNRLHKKAKEYQQNRHFAKMDLNVGLFKPNRKRKKEICKKNVKRLINVLDMRLNRTKMVETPENVNWLDYNNHRILENNVPTDLRRVPNRYY